MSNYPCPKIIKEEICAVTIKKHGLEFLPCFPAEKESEALELKDGTKLKCLDFKEMQPDAWFYKMQILTAENYAGDIVYIGSKLDKFLEKIPRRLRTRKMI